MLELLDRSQRYLHAAWSSALNSEIDLRIIALTESAAARAEAFRETTDRRASRSNPN